MNKKIILSTEIEGILKAVATIGIIISIAFLIVVFITSMTIFLSGLTTTESSTEQYNFCAPLESINCDLIAGNTSYEFIMTTIPTVCEYSEISAWLEVSEKAIIEQLINTSYNIKRIDCKQSFYPGD